VKQWIAEGRAFVCPRQNHRSNVLQLGLTFVDDGVKHRAFIQAGYQDVLRGDSPHNLEYALGMFPENEADDLRDLVAELKTAGFPIYVFGSVAWEIISGRPYRTSKSDLDLLCDVETLQDVRFVTEAFASADQKLPFNIDGELRFANDDCANWREVRAALGHHDEMEILVKGERGVYMSTLDSLLEFTYA
jgi:phosphoribosyl-dephospho-CoA transferase